MALLAFMLLAFGLLVATGGDEDSAKYAELENKLYDLKRKALR